MPKLRETILLIWYLFIIEQILFTIHLWTIDNNEPNWLDVEEVLRSTAFVFVIRVVLTFIPLILLYTIVLRIIHLQRLIFLALLNVIANAIVMGVLSLILFDLMSTPGGQYGLVFMFLSPFILSIIPVFKETIKAATGIELVKIL